MSLVKISSGEMHMDGIREETQPTQSLGSNRVQCEAKEADVEKYLWNRDGLWRVW